jgi:hypothetical protein
LQSHLLCSLRIQDNLLQSAADTPVTFPSRWRLRLNSGFQTAGPNKISAWVSAPS